MTLAAYCGLDQSTVDSDANDATTSTSMRALQSHSLKYFLSGDGLTLMRWLQEDNLWMKLAPVFGNGYLQVVYLVVLVVLTYLQLEYLFFNWTDARRLARIVHADPATCRFLLYMPVMSICAIGKLYVARSLLYSRALEDLHQQVYIKNSATMHEGGRLFKAKAKVARRIRRGLVLPLLISAIFTYAICWHFHAPPRFCYRFVLAWFWSAAIGHVANFATYYALKVGTVRVDMMREELKQAMEASSRPENYYVELINEYWDLDEHLTKLTRDSGHIVAIVVGMTMSGGYITLLLFIVLEDVLLQIFCICALIGCSYAAFITIWPFAKLSDKCSSSSSLLREPSLSMQIMLCGRAHMSQEETLEYLKLVHIVKAAPIGAKLPIFGLITTGELWTYAKVLAAMLPTLLARSIAQMEATEAES